MDLGPQSFEDSDNSIPEIRRVRFFRHVVTRSKAQRLNRLPLPPLTG